MQKPNKNHISMLVSLAMILALLVIIPLAGCGKSEQSNDSSVQDSEQNTSNDSGQNSGNTGLSDRLASVYLDMFKDGKYYMKARMGVGLGGETQDVIQEIAIDGDNFASKSIVAGQDVSLVLKDGKMYTISHNEKTIMIMPFDSSLLDDSGKFPGEGYTFVDSGTAELFGTPQKYEEYSVAGAGNVRFFFDGNQLIGYESSNEDVTVQMEIIELSSTIPAGMFDIPTGYEVMDFS